jgi:hypothetical protein
MIRAHFILPRLYEAPDQKVDRLKRPALVIAQVRIAKKVILGHFGAEKATNVHKKAITTWSQSTQNFPIRGEIT